MYVLMDLERTIRTGVTHYWMSNKMGYTRDLDEAGRYDQEAAEEIVNNDINNLTVFVSEDTLKTINR